MALTCLALALLVSACSESYQEDVTFQVVEVSEDEVRGFVRVKVEGELPGAPVKPFVDEVVAVDRLPAGIRTGDLVVCRVAQNRANFLDSNLEQDLSQCRRR